MSGTRTSGFYRVTHQKHEPKVGLLVLLILAGWIAVLIWSRGGVGGAGDQVGLVVVFEHVQGLTEDDPVMISGVKVGRVTRVELEEAGRVVIALEMNESVRPHADARAMIRPLDFVGSRYIDYRPGGSPQLLEDGAMIAGIGESDLQVTSAAIRDRAARLAFAVQDFLGADLAAEVRATQAAIERAQAAIAALELEPLVADAEAGLLAAHHASEELDSLLAHATIDSSSMEELRANAREVAAGMGVATGALDRILVRIDSGHGTLGRLETDTIIRTNLRAVIEGLRRLVK